MIADRQASFVPVRGHAALPLLVALLIFITGAGASWFAYRYFSEQNEAAMKRALAERMRGSQGRGTGFMALLTDGIGNHVDLFRAFPVADELTLKRFSSTLFSTHPELMALAWVAPDAPLNAGTVVTALDPAGTMSGADAGDTSAIQTPALGAAPAAQTVAPNEPLSPARIQFLVVNTQGPGTELGDGSALRGKDLSADPLLQYGLSNAKLSPFVLYAGFSGDQIILLAPALVDNQLRGHVMALLKRSLLLSIAIKGRAEDGLARRVIDPIGDQGKPMVVYEEFFDQPMSMPLSTLEQDWRVADRIDALGRSWSLELWPTARFFSDRQSQLPIYVFGGGLLLALLLSGFIWTLMSRTARVQQLVNRRTAELGDAYQRVRDSEMMAMQSEKMSSLGQMVAGVAHEINTPLGFISSNVQLMREQLGRLKPVLDNQQKLLAAVNHWTRLTPEQKQLWFKAALAQSSHMQQLKQDGVLDDMDSLTSESLSGLERLTDLVLTLKNFSRLDRAMVDEVDLNTCIEDTLKIAQNVTKQKAAVHLALSNLPPIRCNPSQINQVLLNLVSNAAHAITGFGRIDIKTEVDAAIVRVRVTDNGKGIPPDHLDKIFEPFFTTKPQGEGTGLGLAISKRIADDHGGTLEVASQPGKGTTFTLSLPI